MQKILPKIHAINTNIKQTLPNTEHAKDMQKNQLEISKLLSDTKQKKLRKKKSIKRLKISVDCSLFWDNKIH